MTAELGLKLTYMDVRLLVDDLKLTPKDAEPVKRVESALTAPSAPAATASPPGVAARGKTTPPSAASGKVSVTVDQIARPGAMASGKVTFTDGNAADWYFDTTGRLGLVPQQANYRPPPADLQQFQAALDAELSKIGL